MPVSEMVEIPGGQFTMGTPSYALDQIADQQHYPRSWFEDEEPQHVVSVDSFFLDLYLVTNQEFDAFVRATGYQTIAEERGYGLVYGDSFWAEVVDACWSRPGGPGTEIGRRGDHPVVHIAHADATAFAEWAGKRLPTEEEWEYAACGPTYRCWPWGDEWDRSRAVTAEYWSSTNVADLAGWRNWWAHYRETRGATPGTEPVGTVGSKGRSPFGVYDLAGNALEWTSSWYQLYSRDSIYDEMYHFIEGRYVVLKGGSWMNFRFQVRCAERIPTDPHGYSTFATGFRCARDA
jgi:formylglycine-generating enzyme